MTRTPYIDQDVCIGCGFCAESLPAVFRMTDEQLAEVHDPSGANELRIQDVMEECPVACIHWR